MMISTVHVYHSGGSPARGVRVVLGFSAGMTRPAYTDAYGRALVGHATTGRADVYISGQKHANFHAPGTVAVTL